MCHPTEPAYWFAPSGLRFAWVEPTKDRRLSTSPTTTSQASGPSYFQAFLHVITVGAYKPGG